VFSGCLEAICPQRDRVSLNRCEQRLFDYLESNKHEGQFWREKVQTIAAKAESGPAAVVRIEAELWRYYAERSAVAAPFKEAARHEGLNRTSLQSLAELLVRLWTEPRAKRKPPLI
jgi:hypothetical protein